MNKKISLFFLILLLGFGSLLKAQTISLSVCGYVQSPSSLPYLNPVNMDLFVNGVLVSTQTDTMLGGAVVCFDAVDVETNGASELDFSVTTSIIGCIPNYFTGTVSTSDTIIVELIPCLQNCNAFVSPVSLGGNNYNLQATGNGAPPLTYLWSNGSTDSSIPLNTSQYYSVTVTDSQGCISSANFSPFISGSVFSTLNSNNTLSLETTVFNGLLPYTYEWSNGETTPGITVSDLSPIIYCVTITDAIGTSITICDSIGECFATISESPAGLPNPILEASSSGTAPYTYIWSTGETSQYIVGSLNGNYSVTVTDAFGCSAVDIIFLNTCSINLSISTDPISDSTYMLTAIPEGVPPYSYLWYANGSYVTMPNIEVVQSGIYCCQVTDANGCSNYVCDTVGNCAASIIETIINPTTSYLQANSTGNGPFIYNWNTGETTQTIQPDSSGNYYVIITDATGCSSFVEYYYLQNTPCSTLIFTNQSNPTTFDLFANATGTAPFTYMWSGNGVNNTTPNLTVTQSGIYCCTITDATGCISYSCDTIDLGNTPNCFVTITNTSAVSFPASLTATGTGVEPLNYVWTDSNGAIVGNNSIYFPLGDGLFCCTITDAIGCVNQSCYYYSSNGNCQTTIVDSIVWNSYLLSAYSTGIPPFTYQWYINNAPIVDTASAIIISQSGIYSVVVTDALGCSSLGNLYVDVPQCLPVTNLQFDLNSNVTSIIAGSTGVAPYTYSWTLNGLPLVGEQSISPSINGNYCYTVTDANGCQVSDCYYYTNNPQGNCTAYFSFALDSLFIPSSNMMLVDFVSYPNGSPDFTYFWTFSDGATDTVANPQHWFASSPYLWAWANLTIIDANGCVSSYSNSIPLPYYQQTCFANFSYSSSYNTTSVGEINFQNFSISNSQNVTYLWNFGDGTTSSLENPNHTYTSNGMYNVMLTIDNDGCVSNYASMLYIDLAWWGNSPYGGTCSSGFILLPQFTIDGLAFLVNISQVNNANYLWTISNGTVANGENPLFNLNGAGVYTICLTATDTISGCSDTFCDSLTLDTLGNVFRTANNMFLSSNSTIGLAVVSSPKSTNPSALSEVKNENLISVQPNPANDNITIKLANAEAVNVNIFSVSGELIKDVRINNSTTTVDVSDLSNGIYFVKVLSKEINQTTKLIINH
jgi:hypothetical protein